MALKQSPFRFFWSRLHFVVRLAGLTGLLAGGVGLALYLLDHGTVQATFESLGKQCGEALQALTRWDFGVPYELAVWLVLGGAAAAALALLIEAVLMLRFAAGRRSVFGGNALVQMAIALALLVGVNVFSAYHYFRFDWSHDRQFTLSAHLSAPLLDQLQRLRDSKPTTIVVYQRNKSFSQLSDKPDVYDYAASPRVVEKVRDLVDEFREMGGKFRVVILDVEEEGYGDKLAKLTQDAPELKEAIEQAPENSIFFYVAGNSSGGTKRPGKVQRLGFHDIFQLDKRGSEQAGNLVLLNQGVDTFARKLLNIEEKRPRIALGIIHEVLGTEGSEELGMMGLKKTLLARGFDVRDVILKKWSEFAPPEPAVLTYDESKYERLDAELSEVEENIKNAETERRGVTEMLKDFQTAKLDDLSKKYQRELRGRKATEQIRKIVLPQLKENIELINFVLGQLRSDRAELLKQKSGLQVENLQEQRRISDLKAKTERMLADCDLLILPRMTLFNVARVPPEVIPNQVYKLDNAQVEAIKDFLKKGKPVLACFGPPNEPSGLGMPPPSTKPDDLEKLFNELGFQLPRQTILFNVESKAFAQRRGGLLILGANVEVPSVRFEWKNGDGYPQKLAEAGRVDQGKLNPICESLQLTARSLGKDQKLELRLRHPRPVYYDPSHPKTLPYQATFMMTDPASWNDPQPFPTRERTPRYEQPKETDAANGTVAEKRRGPFPIAAAVETTLPQSWYENKDAKPATARVAVIGHGGVFMGTTLSPVREKLLTDTCNWLLGRDDLLTRNEVLVQERDGSKRPDDNRWQYPRVELSQRDKTLWQWGIWLGLPALFAYLGLVMFMVRRLR